MPFRLEGFYTHTRYPIFNSQDDGYMNFPLQHNPETGIIRGAGNDNAGPFTIQGIYDGTNIRFVKRYPSWDWKYVGVAAPNGQGGTWFTGGWGQGNEQHGVFALLANPANRRLVSTDAAKAATSKRIAPWGPMESNMGKLAAKALGPSVTRGLQQGFVRYRET